MKTVPFDFEEMKGCSCILEFLTPEDIIVFEETYVPDGHKTIGYDAYGPKRFRTMLSAYNETYHLCFRFDNGEWKNIGERDTYNAYDYRHYLHMVFDPDRTRSNLIEVGDLL